IDLEHAKFDLTPGSRSLQVLHDYMEERKKRLKVEKHAEDIEPAASSNGDQKDHEEISLSPEEEAALEADWDRIEQSRQRQDNLQHVAEWKPEEHPRGGDQDYPGRFSKGQGGGAETKEKPEPEKTESTGYAKERVALASMDDKVIDDEDMSEGMN